MMPIHSPNGSTITNGIIEPEAAYHVYANIRGEERNFEPGIYAVRHLLCKG
jgi:hypothetical protein